MENALEDPSFFSMYAENFDPRNDGFLFSLHSRAFLSFRPVSLSFRAIISLVPAVSRLDKV